FSPQCAPGRLYLRDNGLAPWPTAKLLDQRVIWRPEWCLPHRQGPGSWEDGASAGGVFSWAVEPANLSEDEGFEVSLRDEPGPRDAKQEKQEKPCENAEGAA
ncbi:unnamed protein product, partial [Effrenium voratum]